MRVEKVAPSRNHSGPDVATASMNGSDDRAQPKISVVIPALNEAKNLPYVFAELPADIYEIVLVDGSSTDGTTEVARELFPAVRIVGQTRRGKGNALSCGFAACRGEIIVMLDADGSADPTEIPRFVEALVRGADFAKGSRFLDGGGSADITTIRRLGNACLGRLVNVLFGTRYTDLCYGYNAFWTRCLPDLSVDCDGFEVETLINIRAARAGLVVSEVPSYEQSRIYGESNLHAVRDGLRVLRTIMRERLRRQVRVTTRPAASSAVGS
jgi:glycosyltransferase involved in cell wall biosynthesis